MQEKDIKNRNITDLAVEKITVASRSGNPLFELSIIFDISMEGKK